MSLDPVKQSLPPNVAAYIAGELSSLADDARVLHTRLNIGDIVAAIVLPSNGLTDLIKIDGLRVAAELPPSVLPGEAIFVEVTGFADDRILLHIVPQAAIPAAAQGSTPPDVTRTNLPPSESPSAPVPANDVPARTAVTAQLQAPRAAGAPIANIEARLAAAHAAGNRSSAHSAGPLMSPVMRPLIVQRALVAAVEQRSVLQPAGAARLPATYTEPASLLRALQLPVTASNVASVHLALESPERLGPALATLERALAVATEPHVITARTLLAFVARIEPQSPVLAAQIAAFVDHVADGREPKLVRLLTAYAQAAAAPVDGNASAGECVAFRQADVDTDLKSQLLAVAHDTTVSTAAAAGAKAVPTALAGALSALTALQLNAATALAANPDGLAFWLPVALPDGFARAQIQIDRKTPQARHAALDGDNFHIGFVLETQHLGTVAIDLLTVGRSVSVGVKTESEHAQRAFASALTQLTQRLEALHYRVSKAAADIAPRGAVHAEAAPAAAEPLATDRLVDIDA